MYFSTNPPPGAWYPNLNQSIKIRLQSSQNKCIRFCLKLGNRVSVEAKHFKEINWINLNDRFDQILLSNIFKFLKSFCPRYLNEIYFPADQEGVKTRFSYQKLKIPKRKTSMGLKSISYIGPALWNKLPSFLKYAQSLNNFKHMVKEYFFKKVKMKQSS